MNAIPEPKKTIMNYVMEAMGFRIPADFLEYCNKNAKPFVRWIGFLMGPLHLVFYFSDSAIAGGPAGNEILRILISSSLILLAILTYTDFTEYRYLMVIHLSVWLVGQCINTYYLKDHQSAPYTVCILFIAGGVLLHFKPYKYFLLTIFTVCLYFFILVYLLKLPLDESVRVGHYVVLIGCAFAGCLIAVVTWKRNLRDWKQVSLLEEQHSVLDENNRKFLKELALAEKVQRKLLPMNKFSDKNISIDFLYLPSGIIGGDFLDIIPLGKNKYGLLIADVSGHGVASALISSMLKMAFYSQEKHILEHPDKTLDRLNNILIENLDSDFITSIYGIIDLNEREFTFSIAGHDCPVIYRGNPARIINIDNRGRALGISKDNIYKSVTVSLNSGDLIYFFTDGCFEIRKENMEHLDLETFIRILKKNSTLPFQKIINGILEDIYSICGKVNQEDDITLIVCRVSITE